MKSSKRIKMQKMEQTTKHTKTPQNKWTPPKNTNNEQIETKKHTKSAKPPEENKKKLKGQKLNAKTAKKNKPQQKNTKTLNATTIPRTLKTTKLNNKH